jgi:DNA-binding Lrp family transcriptional regulator
VFETEPSIKMGSCALTRVPPAGELQQDGRLTVTELAGVGLSLSPCHRRLRTLQQSGAISGYHAHLDASGTPTILGSDLVPDAVPRRYIQGASEA